jgi:hypothetical protein
MFMLKYIPLYRLFSSLFCSFSGNKQKSLVHCLPLRIFLCLLLFITTIFSPIPNNRNLSAQTTQDKEIDCSTLTSQEKKNILIRILIERIIDLLAKMQFRSTSVQETRRLHISRKLTTSGDSDDFKQLNVAIQKLRLLDAKQNISGKKRGKPKFTKELQKLTLSVALMQRKSRSGKGVHVDTVTKRVLTSMKKTSSRMVGNSVSGRSFTDLYGKCFGFSGSIATPTAMATASSAPVVSTPQPTVSSAPPQPSPRPSNIPTVQTTPVQLPISNIVTKFRFFPRKGFASRLINGKVVGSNTNETTNFIEIGRITTSPNENQWNEVTLNTSKVFRYIKYLAADNQPTSIAEIEFYNGNTKLSGAQFGTTAVGTNLLANAFDNNPDTYFESTISSSYAGIDLGAAVQAAKPSISPSGGNFTSTQTISISTTTQNATIRYTTDGSTPNESIGLIYRGPFQINTNVSTAGSTVVLAVAFKQGLAESPLATEVYRFNQPTSTATPVVIAPPPVTGRIVSYHLGNSLTDTFVNALAPIMQSGGFQYQLYRSTIPGAPTDWLWDHPGDGFGERDYREVFRTKAPITHLTLQPFAAHGRSLDNETDYGSRFYRLARENSPSVQLWVYAQWTTPNMNDSWAKGNVGGLSLRPATNWSEAISNHMAYHEALRQRLENANPGKQVLIIPGGPALSTLKKEVEAGRFPGTTNFFSYFFEDDIHLNNRGAYLISLVLYSCFTRQSPEGKVTTAGSNLSNEQAAIIQRIAWDTVRNYQWSGVR